MGCILVIDDNSVIRELLRVLLEDAGYTVEEAANGSEGIQIVKEKEVDLMISDVIMPDKGGIEMMIELHQDYPDLKTILITGHVQTDSEAFQNIAKQFGASQIFTKPLDSEAIVKAVKELLPD